VILVSDQRWAKVTSLAHGTTFETALWLKVEVEARSKAGTGPTAGRFEPTAGNETLHSFF